MGAWALIFVLFGLNGQVMVDGGLYPTQEACQVTAATFPARIAEHNASAENPVKILQYAVQCVKLEKVPQGKAS